MMLLMCDTRPSRLPELEFKDYSCDVIDSHMNTWLFRILTQCLMIMSLDVFLYLILCDEMCWTIIDMY